MKSYVIKIINLTFLLPFCTLHLDLVIRKKLVIVILSESIKRHVVKLTFSALDRCKNVTYNLILLFNFLFHMCDSSIRLLLNPLKKNEL